LFSKGRKIIFSIEFVYKEITSDSTAKSKKKKKSATQAQKIQRAANASLWNRVYKRYRCRGKHCKQGPHCWPDEQGNHCKLLPGQLEEIVYHIKGNMKEGETEGMLILISRSHPTFSKIYWIIAVSGRQIALLTVVIAKSMSQRQYLVKILQM
jgi:hypothetical protein